MKWLLAAGLLLGVGLVASRCRPPGTVHLDGPEPASVSGPTASMEGMRATEFRNGVKRWDLAAERATYDQGPDRTVLSGVTLTLTGKKPVGPLVLVAPTAEFINSSKNLLLPAGVSATGERHLQFTARQAAFSNASSTLTARGGVRYQDDLLQVEGEEMVFDTESRALRLKRNVRAVIQPQAVKR